MWIPAYKTREAIDKLVKNRRSRTRRIWSLFRPLSFYISDPFVWAASIRDSIPLLGEEFKEEAQQLFEDITELLRNPPLP